MTLPKHRPPRIFIGLTEVSGYYARLKQGFDELGIECEFFPLQAHRFAYAGQTHDSVVSRLVRYCVNQRIKSLEDGPLRRAFWLAMVIASRVPLFIWAMWKFDVFLMGGGSSFFRFYELPLMRLFGKVVVYTFHGTDSRPAYIDGFCEGVPHPSAPGPDWPDKAAMRTYLRVAAQRRRVVRRVERYADMVVNAPPQAQFHTKPFAIGLAVGLPFDIEPQTSAPQPAGQAVRILHCPSFHSGKGTIEIRHAIEQLRAEGLAIDYVEISNRPNAEVLMEIARCDFVVDQVYSDSPMAGFAAEAAFAAKPAVVGGYYSAHVAQDLAADDIPPSIYCHPAGIVDAIRKLILDSDLRIGLGRRAQEFVSKRWTAQVVAGRYLQIIDGSFPREWLYDPSRNRYFHGMGLPESHLRAILSSVVRKYGKSWLMLDEHPVLQQSIVKFTERES